MSRHASGFTMVELLVAMVILAILSVLVFHRCRTGASNMKLQTAETITRVIATANRTHALEHVLYATGTITNSNLLVRNGYLHLDNWGDLGYTFLGADDPNHPCLVAQAVLKTGGPLPVSSAPASGYGVCISTFGEVQQFDGRCSLCVSSSITPAR